MFCQNYFLSAMTYEVPEKTSFYHDNEVQEKTDDYVELLVVM